MIFEVTTTIFNFFSAGNSIKCWKYYHCLKNCLKRLKVVWEKLNLGFSVVQGLGMNVLLCKSCFYFCLFFLATLFFLVCLSYSGCLTFGGVNPIKKSMDFNISVLCLYFKTTFSKKLKTRHISFMDKKLQLLKYVNQFRRKFRKKEIFAMVIRIIGSSQKSCEWNFLSLLLKPKCS